MCAVSAEQRALPRTFQCGNESGEKTLPTFKIEAAAHATFPSLLLLAAAAAIAQDTATLTIDTAKPVAQVSHPLREHDEEIKVIPGVGLYTELVNNRTFQIKPQG